MKYCVRYWIKQVTCYTRTWMTPQFEMKPPKQKLIRRHFWSVLSFMICEPALSDMQHFLAVSHVQHSNQCKCPVWCIQTHLEFETQCEATGIRSVDLEDHREQPWQSMIWSHQKYIKVFPLRTSVCNEILTKCSIVNPPINNHQYPFL